MAAKTSGYGTAPWWAAIILSVIVTFIGTLLFAQATWNYNNPGAKGSGGTSTTGHATSQPASQPATQPKSQPAGKQTDAAPTDPRQAAADGKAIQPGAVPDVAPDPLHKPWDELLKKYLSNELVAYDTWQNSAADMKKLDDYLAAVAATDLNSRSSDERLALWINLYNAGMVDIILDRYKPGYAVSENNWGVFDEAIVPSPEGKISLNHLEHKIIRVRFDEPGIHAAVVCGALSCPPLIKDAYHAQTLDAQLTRNVYNWLHDPARNDVNHETQTLHLSQIFNWYAQDFGGAAGVPNYVNPYFEADVSGYRVVFKEYDWSLNIQK